MAAKVKKATPASSPKSASSDSIKFTLYNFAGQPKSYYRVDKKNLEREPEENAKQAVAHSIIIIDRSGSMYYDIEDLKETLLKILTLDEYSNYQLLVTLISYSSRGDVICHFQRIPISEVMQPNSFYQQQIKQIESTGATCISQSMKLALSLIQADELTAITLHTDGYANDPSSQAEIKELDRLTEELTGYNAFLNTIAYSSADFRLLAKLANTASGSCLKAGNVKQVYDALYSTSKLLCGLVASAIEETLIKEYDYQVFVSHSAQKINGAAGTIKIIGLKPEDDGIFYKYQKITKQEYDQLDIPPSQTHPAVFAFAKANLADGNLNTAKYALASTFDATLTEKHAKALTNAEIAEMAVDLEQAIFNPAILNSHEILTSVKVSDKTSVLELVKVLEQHRSGIIINLPHLKENYQRKGIKRIPGSRDKDGNLLTPWLKTEYIDGDKYVKMGTFSINQNTATINMLITRKVKLVKVEDGEQICEVGGILVSELESFNNYTIVSDGEINIKSLKVKINNGPAFDALKSLGVLEQDGQTAGAFDCRREYDIRLDNLPVSPFTAHYGSINGTFDELAQMKILSSIISAHLKEESDVYAPEQIEELKLHYLSKNLYINFPTTTEYTDLHEAINKGTVDSRVSYKIDIGNKDILNLSKLHSANKFLDRLYEVVAKDSGEVLEKPSFELTWEKNLTFSHKKLSSRTKITPVDDLMKRIFDNFLGLEDNGTVAAILTKVGADSLARLLAEKAKGNPVTRPEFVTALVAAKGQIDAHAEQIYRDNISPLVFYIGSTGLLPDEMDAKAQSADELSSKYPTLKFSKDEQEGMFFEVGDTIISVYAKNEYFSR
ncbi:MAG TPA: VWA domain-containing protein [Oscillatoriaceae cyanobacterium M33_DOE_052]|uniref:VWA domain-containing protein n=1 Tax=Planktothricoides sp. SpSt-374 TaxID=2282167 RepID=A0A7C3VUR1_9CYAN|nr:VWA domain-containing protein [Oscillatoriaceae cyanobacterium M33_DOE_052]